MSEIDRWMATKPDGTCFWCQQACGGTCLGVDHPHGPVQMRPDDPAYWLLSTGHVSTKEVHREGCYICEDPEFAQMGLPLCQPCKRCGGHVQADGDGTCDDCGADMASHHPCPGCGEAVPTGGTCPECPPPTAPG